MDDPTSHDRVPLDRPPVPRFSPLPDLPDLPELPRGSAMMPTPSIPIPAPPLPSLPAPRVMVDLPRPSPSVSIDPPKPRPLPTPPKPAATPPVPTPVVASTPAPKGRWVGEALASLVTPTKSKVTVLAAAGSLVAGAFALQLLVGSGGDTATTKPTKPPEVAAAKKPAEESTTRQQEAQKPEEPTGIRMPTIPDPKPLLAATPASTDPLPGFGMTDGVTRSTGVDTATSPAPQPLAVAALTGSPASPLVLPKVPAAFGQGIVTAAAESPAPPAMPPGMGLPDLKLPTLPVAPVAVPPNPAPVPTTAAPIPVPAPLVPTPVPAPIAESQAQVVLPTPPGETGKQTAPPMPPTKPSDPLKLPETPPAKPTRVEQNTPALPPGLGFKIDPDPPAPMQPLPVAPAPAAVAPTPVPAFGIVETPPQPKLLTPPTPPADARTDFDVDLHPAKAGQTYEAVSQQHYADAKYAEALRAFNKGRDPGRDVVEIPPLYVARKLAAGTRAPAAVNPIAPAAAETWARPTALGDAKPAAAGRSYTVPQDGTTFRDLAGTLLNDRKLYRRISDLNPTIDANAKLQKGDKVTVP